MGGAGGAGGSPIDMAVAPAVDMGPAVMPLPVCTPPQRLCGASCVASPATDGCCVDADCLPQGAKVGRCDQSKYACSYECGPGTKPCNGGCMPDGACCPSGEICDGKDNDCDGATDESLTMPCTTQCGTGMQTCSNGGWGACSAGSPSTEVCDNKDNDCNGRVDDGVTRDCPTSCGPGKEICSGGKWGACSARQPSQTNVNSCGSSCVTCNSAPANGTPTCVNGQCNFDCKANGFKAKCNGQCVQCCGADASTCGAGESCVNDQCTCVGIKCGGNRCVGKKKGCVALIRSQTADPCFTPGDPIGCRGAGPSDDLAACTIGVIRRQIIAETASCDFASLGRAGCKTYICQNRQPGLDITMPIYVSYANEKYDDNGNHIGGDNPQNTSCQDLGVTSCN